MDFWNVFAYNVLKSSLRSATGFTHLEYSEFFLLKMATLTKYKQIMTAIFYFVIWDVGIVLSLQIEKKIK